MKKLIFAFSMVLSLGLVAVAQSQSVPPAKKEAPPAKKEAQPAQPDQPVQKAAKTVNGEVVSVDTAKNELVVKAETGDEVRLQVAKDAKVTKEGKAILLAELKPSEKVTCEAEEVDGAWMAKSIRVSSTKTAKTN